MTAVRIDPDDAPAIVEALKSHADDLERTAKRRGNSGEAYADHRRRLRERAARERAIARDVARQAGR